MEGDPTSDLARAGVLVAKRYRLESIIGRGGMGSVWAATHLGLGHKVAIKLISREFTRSPDALRRFDAEAKAAARLQSRHVVQVYDNGTLDDGTPYIAMELLDGESLQHRIDERGPIALADAVNILAQCCKALARAHALGIVHRDIKPDNIYLARTPDEDGDVAKILDFGVAKVAIDGNQGQTGTGMLLGTPLYMSPEQARGLKTLDSRADLYSLGLAAFTMLSGKLAIDGESFGEILLKICAEPLPSLCAAAPWLPPSMEGWFQRVCAREPAARCATAQEFAETLALAAGQRPVPQRLSAEGSGPIPLAAIAPTLAVAEGFGGPAKAASVNLSGVNMAITAAGVPKRNTGVIVLAIATTLAVGGAVAFIVARPSAGPSPDPSADTRSAAVPALPAPPASASAPTLAAPPAPTLAVVPAPAPAPTPTRASARALTPSPPSPIATKPTPAPPPTHSAGLPVINLGY